MNYDYQLMFLQKNEHLNPHKDYYTVLTDDNANHITGLAEAVRDAIFESEHDAEAFAMGLEEEGLRTEIWSFRRVQ